MHLHVIGRRASVSPATLQKHLQPQWGKVALALSLVLLSGPDAKKCLITGVNCTPLPRGRLLLS